MANQPLPQPQRPQPAAPTPAAAPTPLSTVTPASVTTPAPVVDVPAASSAPVPAPKLTPTPVPGQSAPPISAPVVSVPAPVTTPAPQIPSVAPSWPSAPPAASSAPAPTSKLMQNLQSVSSQPFKDPSAPVETSAPTVETSGPKPIVPPTVASTVPQEAPTAARTSLDPVRGRKVAAQPGVAGSGGWRSRLNRRTALIAGGLLSAILIASGAAWFFLRPSTETPGSPSPSATTKQVTLTYWGLWEPESVMAPIIAKYEAENPGVKINYTQQNSRQYRQRLQAAIRDGSGPDIYRFHNTWVPMLAEDLSPAPNSVFSPAMLQQDFYPVVARDLVLSNQVVGVPLMYEGLALLYNQNMLQAANALPPSDWQQVRELAVSLTIKNGQRIERGGIALGTAENVDHFSDILALMMLQNSADLANPASVNAQSALEFFTIFSRVDQVWDATLPPSTQAFASEQVAMIFAPSWRIHEIQNLNPNLSIGVARLPQIDGTQVSWATYWAEGVSSTSRNKEESWKFLNYLSQPEQLRAMHSDAGAVRAYGELYPRVSMASELKTNPMLSPYLDDALYSQSWYLASDTLDEGLNAGLIQYYTDAVNAMNQSGNAERALQAILPGLQQVLSRYGLGGPVVAQ